MVKRTVSTIPLGITMVAGELDFEEVQEVPPMTEDPSPVARQRRVGAPV